MSRDEGFAVMDVSVDIANDPKVRRLWRERPEQAGVGFYVYTATVGESWKAGQRVTAEYAWPATVPFDDAVVGALRHVGLLDRSSRVPATAWRGWFEPAKTRRDAARERWRRANEKRHADAAMLPRGSDAVTASTVPSVPSVPPDKARRDDYAVEKGAGPRLVEPVA